MRGLLAISDDLLVCRSRLALTKLATLIELRSLVDPADPVQISCKVASSPVAVVRGFARFKEDGKQRIPQLDQFCSADIC
jgi:hypothetical protein